ncbi:hypothetical protein DFH08DRAFT_1029177 [Mycena albidolilacea]|uniref:Uncharacterized protein n=1 Tax=Mycena albidolilacea TaxID=1033008 RepID=A0AAD6ZIC5_9AGAR|nr:hypothetical protein DFH08DRAFT_1029177 [Mycena albidolilacea]
MPASQAPLGTEPCSICGVKFMPRGIRSHEAACKAKAENAQKDRAFTANVKEQRRTKYFGQTSCLFSSDAVKAAGTSRSALFFVPGKQPTTIRTDPPESPPLNSLGSPSHHSNNDSDNDEIPVPKIKGVFHPHSKQPVLFQSFVEYTTSNRSERAVQIDPAPWKPFRTRLDFEVAEFCELAMLNKDMTETLLSLIRRCSENFKDFTITNQSELDKLWSLASHKCTEFVEDSITVPYKKENRTFKTYTRPLWDWVLGLVQDPQLASCFVWDAEKAYKFNGDVYMRFYHEPWTADAFWEAQSLLPNNPLAKLVGLIIYVDKSKLSTFGTEKAYAVVARVANIPVYIRNSNTQFGGGQVKEDAKENNKPAFTNFKNVVWHAAFWKLLESLVHHAKLSSWTILRRSVGA